MCVRVRMCVSIPINHIVACAAGCGGVNAVVAVVVVNWCWLRGAIRLFVGVLLMWCFGFNVN